MTKLADDAAIFLLQRCKSSQKARKQTIINDHSFISKVIIETGCSRPQLYRSWYTTIGFLAKSMQVVAIFLADNL